MKLLVLPIRMMVYALQAGHLSGLKNALPCRRLAIRDKTD